MNKTHMLAFWGKWTIKKYTQACSFFSSIEEIWEAPHRDLVDAGWNKQTIDSFFDWKNTFDATHAQRHLDSLKAHIVSYSDTTYPPLLKNIYDPPPFLFVQGLLPQTGPFVAVVGPRKASVYGKTVTQLLVPKLAQAGIVIVSGLALGIDRAAHTATIQSRGKTIGVLGTGLLDASPAIYHDVSTNGAVITEYPPGTPGSRYTFPKRNRIIAGICTATLIIEAGESSGALVTAQCAIDTNREVLAVPQNITSTNSIGVNQLLKQGAHFITRAQDILDILHIDTQTIVPKEHISLTDIERTVLDMLSRDPIHIDMLSLTFKKSSAVLNTTLMMLEMKGMIKDTGGMTYIRLR